MGADLLGVVSDDQLVEEERAGGACVYGTGLEPDPVDTLEGIKQVIAGGGLYQRAVNIDFAYGIGSNIRRSLGNMNLDVMRRIGDILTL